MLTSHLSQRWRSELTPRPDKQHVIVVLIMGLRGVRCSCLRVSSVTVETICTRELSVCFKCKSLSVQSSVVGLFV